MNKEFYFHILKQKYCSSLSPSLFKTKYIVEYIISTVYFHSEGLHIKEMLLLTSTPNRKGSQKLPKTYKSLKLILDFL